LIFDIFLEGAYNLDRLPQREAIRIWYQNQLANKLTPLILDCGANIGIAARYFSEKYPEAMICGIEPDGQNCEIARRNTRGSGVEIRQGAVAAENGRGTIRNTDALSLAYQVVPETDGNVEFFSIQSLLDGFDSRHIPFLIKIDIEGGEADLFAGNREWIERFPIIIIELHDWLFPGTSNSSSFLSAIAGMERDFIYRGENVFSISNRIFSTL
jgi:FkbM family methyltransferase